MNQKLIQLSGNHRILQAYSKDCFQFSENFLRITLPSTESVTRSEQDTPQVTPQDTMQVTVQDTMQVGELLKVFMGVHNREELQKMLGLSDREHFRKTYLQPAIEAGLVALTIPDKPTSRNQRYYLTEKGKQKLAKNK